MLSAEILVVGSGITGSSIAHFLSHYYSVTLLSSPNLPDCHSLATVCLRNSKIKKNKESLSLFEDFVEKFEPEGVFAIEDGFLVDQKNYHQWLQKDIHHIYDTLYSYSNNIAYTKHHSIQFEQLILCLGHYNSFFQFYKEPGEIMRGIFTETKVPDKKIFLHESPSYKLIQINHRLLQGVYSDHHYSLFYNTDQIKKTLNNDLTDCIVKIGFRYSEKKGFTPIFLDKNVLYVNGAYKNGYLYSQWMAQKVFKCLTEK